ncbi:MAG: hypothetical protein DRJ67_01070 [Thermoprotei archaeon]|nr:MAG: hypothetical protein DRJ67_01070 [Thermoprotei archaeon]
MSYRRGWQAEYRLVQLLRERGFLASRLPRSGKSPYSFDIIAVKAVNTIPYVVLIEVKMRSRPGTIYLERSRAKSLIKLALQAAAEPLIALYIKRHRRWYIRPVDSRDKDTGKYFVYKFNNIWRPLDEYFHLAEFIREAWTIRRW